MLGYVPKPSFEDVVDFAIGFGHKVVWPKVLGETKAQSLSCRD